MKESAPHEVYIGGISRAPASRESRRMLWRVCAFVVSLFVLSVGTGCFSSEQGETFYGRVAVQPEKELRWSDGGLPRLFDPALAAAAPDTDAVRAIFEGLTEYDPQTLAPIPAVAERWEADTERRVWTFYLRPNARWSNGDPVTATDFERAWRRALELGAQAPHRALLANIQGAQPVPDSSPEPSPSGTPVPANTPAAAAVGATPTQGDGTGVEVERVAKTETNETRSVARSEFGVEVVSPRVLRVRLVRPDPNFPALVAHMLFRPLHESNLSPAASRRVPPGAARTDGESEPPAAPRLFVNPAISNGAFKLGERTPSEVTLTPSENYWDRSSVELRAVRFIQKSSIESALAAYRAGEIDAISNATLEPLTIKLLAPHEDFRRTTFGALNYYVFNRNLSPFDDPRVREAFALAVDRQRLSRDTLGGATEPAQSFLPAQLIPEKSGDVRLNAAPAIRTDIRRAQQLLAEAGFPRGSNFPVVRLLINRNETQRSVARAVVAMWREALGVETELIIKEWGDYEAALASGDYDIARRSVVMQTPDERFNIGLLFMKSVENDQTEIAVDPSAKPADGVVPPLASPDLQASASKDAHAAPVELFTTHEQVLREMPGIPLYFASSFALVKPYVANFDQNLFDAPLLKRVRINHEWSPPAQKSTINIER